MAYDHLGDRARCQMHQDIEKKIKNRTEERANKDTEKHISKKK